MELFHAWICYMQVYKEGETVGIQGMGLFRKEDTLSVTVAELEEFTVQPSMLS